MGDLNRIVTLEIRGHLAKRRLKRSDVADVLDVSLRTVSDLLGERRPWRVDEIETIGEWLDISVSEMMFPKHTRYSSRKPQSSKKPPAEEPPLDFEAEDFTYGPLRGVDIDHRADDGGAKGGPAPHAERAREID